MMKAAAMLMSINTTYRNTTMRDAGCPLCKSICLCMHSGLFISIQDLEQAYVVGRDRILVPAGGVFVFSNRCILKCLYDMLI